ncbi:Gfo/Idh/MocA family oxidoreductase [Zobellia galactanivorans]|uniref:Gfo/Idh/MocA family oxidoreductase n=1 Tax=Zobellia galactanivorans (strain DSM 12802 / CCUG 47099 / CIP 106680 / NCIMB 13871 / Dsij) TaxID=63186 RepID=UPI001C0719FC|nr:Gfo/Idh/MocA family oxidoreductase [Zobellia galactanivorans]MBU3025143.1 Gfo/Idh/MocA family oxidoreductase [Zobellia galactanivorans]
MKNSRRKFLTSVSMLAATTALPLEAFAFNATKKLSVVLVGTGIRGITFWGKRLIDQYSDIIEFVGLSDINPSRLAYAKTYIGASCPTFSDFEEMVKTTRPDLVIVTTKDSTHHQFIIKGLEMGCDVLTEKPLTTDETKCQSILEAERKSKKNLIVGFNYRWSPYATKIKELLMNKTIGDLVSVDFNWYLNTYHGASYFRRWHGDMNSSGSLWVHKATHHFDLLNWWINSEPEEVFAYGDLEFYGKNGPFRGDNCRSCQHSSKCDFHWDINQDKFMKALYVDHEHEDGYIRDNCLFREDIDIYDKMSAQVKYADNTTLNYSLTTYSPFEGWRVAFNGTKGRIEASQDIPYFKESSISEAEKHQKEMTQTDQEDLSFESIIVHPLWQPHKTLAVPMEKSGHGGGDKRLQDKIFRTSEIDDPYGRTAGIRDGAMSILIGIAARRSIENKKTIQISELTDLKPRKQRS